MRILIAEDDSLSRIVLERTVRTWGHEVVVTTDGRAAWEALQSEDAPRLAILDWMMPELDGVEICRRVRSLDQQDPPYLILLTAKNQKEDVLAGFESGADDYLLKPFDRGELRSRLRVGERIVSLQLGLAQRVRELEEREASLRSIVETAAEGILTTDENGIVESFNQAAARIFGYLPEEILGRNVALLMTAEGEAHGCLLASHSSGLGNAATLPREARGRRRDGTLFPVRLGVSEVRTARGLTFTGILSDLSAERQLQCELAQAQRLESAGQLAAGIAHEINTPIQYVGDNTRFLQDAFAKLDAVLADGERLLFAVKVGKASPDMIAEVERRHQVAELDYLREEIPAAIEQSLEGIKRVTGIVRAMKEFSHPGSDEKVSVNLNEAIATTMTVSRNEWKYVAEIETHFDAELPVVDCLPGEINQVILNLIVNAAHAIEARLGKGSSVKGTITISTSAEEDWVEFRIGDTGCGIPEEICRRVFDPFFTTKEVGKGTGQGLAIARSVVVDKHGGAIQFQTKVGQGTTFIVRLPCHLKPHKKELAVV